MAFDLYEPEEKNEYIESVLDFPEGSLVALTEKGGSKLRTILEADNVDMDDFLSDIQKIFDEYT